MKPPRSRDPLPATPEAGAPVLDADRIAQLRAELLAAKARLVERRSAIDRDIGHQLSADSKEQAVELENAEVLDRLREDAQSRLPAINAALARLEDGHYGICVECQEEIPVPRLVAFPQATRCITCARDAEPQSQA